MLSVDPTTSATTSKGPYSAERERAAAPLGTATARHPSVRAAFTARSATCEADDICTGCPGDLKSVDAHSSQADDCHSRPRSDATLRDYRAVRGAERACHGCGVHGVDRLGYARQPVEWGNHPFPEASRMRKTGPRPRIGAQILLSRAATPATAAWPDRMHEDRRTRELVGRVCCEHPRTDLVAGYMGKSERRAERHRTPPGLDVAVAETTSEDFEQRRATPKLRLG